MFGSEKYGQCTELIGTDLGRISTITSTSSVKTLEELLALEAPAERYLYWPFEPRSIYITQHFIKGRHEGLDIGIGNGTKIFSPLPVRAQIVWAGWNNQGYGNMIGLRNNGFGLYVILAHLQKINPDLRVGDWVEPGDFLGWSDSTGNSTGPHLHIEVRENQGDLSSGYYPYPLSCIDPLKLLRWRTEVPQPPVPPTPPPLPSGAYRAVALRELNTYTKQKLKFLNPKITIAKNAVIQVKNRKYDKTNDIEWVIMESGLFTPKRWRGQIYIRELNP